MQASKKIKKKKIDSVGIHAFSRPANFFFSILIGIIALSSILPFIFVIMISITDESVIATQGFNFWPSKFGVDGYLFLVNFKDKILNSLFITLFVTVVGTATNVFITTTYAYAISRRTFKYKRFFTVFALITMLFNAGLVPGYIVVTQLLHIGNTIAALIVPMLLSPFNIILMRTFFKRNIPEAILESARIDGASETRIFFQISLPLALPGIATISLFTALGFWNDWFNALLYIKNPNLYPLQYLLMQIQSNMDYIAKSSGLSSQLAGAVSALPKETGRMAMVVVATLPIALLYPFFQRYFVKGLTIGGVKE
ncbi:carbohydrate ABC transporter permease [Streptococcus sp. DD13]|uniref:carbohydrate ABC transporter permease n=1 Tax=Streptococcus sp. DD13 TaxID=1777881 RepID=UPI00079638AB|nr:carbohydrate ABC transporter permease [Streptococcus sp. DD13]KXT78959.1 Multiple sugar ABC transporter, membrane-spanning permease protein MsmG [Streptococcus sp. DD13]